MNKDGMSMEDARTEGYEPSVETEMAEIILTGKLSAEREEILKVIQLALHEAVMSGDKAKVQTLSGISSEVIKGSLSVEKAKEDIEKLRA
jgi:hypothetical protein